VQKTGCIVTAEEHNYLGGMGESIAGMLSRYNPTPLEFVATQDCFGESGTPVELMQKYGLNKSSIIQKSKEVIKRK
jgi:transketolase